VPLLARLLGSGAAPQATQFDAAWALAIVAAWDHYPSVHVRCVASAPGAVKGIVNGLAPRNRSTFELVCVT
jgi:predicted transcriptional regulator with HTH domain